MEDGRNCNGKVVKEADNQKQTVCRRCKELYTAASNSPDSCRFHPSFFVCRRHDDQKSWMIKCMRLVVTSVVATIIVVMYYELGPDDPPYAAKFYDCCGAEDPDAPGCTTSFHISHDDE